MLSIRIFYDRIQKLKKKKNQVIPSFAKLFNICIYIFSLCLLLNDLGKGGDIETNPGLN